MMGKKEMVRQYLNNSILNIDLWLDTCQFLRLIPEPAEKEHIQNLMNYFNFTVGTDRDWEEMLDVLWSIMGDCIPTSEFGLILLSNFNQLRYFQPWCDLDDQMCVINPSIVATAGSDGFIPLNFILHRAGIISDPAYCKERKPRSFEKRCPVQWFNDHYNWDK